jgi:glutamate synthase (NADPH/NADH) large chain
MVGRVDRLDMRKAIDHWKAKGIDLSRCSPGRRWAGLAQLVGDAGPRPEKALDNDLIAAAPALERASRCASNAVINVNRTVGAMLSGEVAKRYGHAGLPDNTIT